VLAIIFFIAEIKVASYGMLSLGGLISLVLGSIMLFDNMRVSLQLMMPTIALIGGFFVVVAGLAFRAYRSKPKSGTDGLIGEVGLVKKKIDPEGLIFVHGEYWRAIADSPIEPDESVEVIGMDGLILKVQEKNDDVK
jgi:membrane-bound serine protease (ClpP class)